MIDRNTQIWEALQKPCPGGVGEVKVILGVAPQNLLTDVDKQIVLDSIPAEHPVKRFLADRTTARPLDQESYNILQNLKYLGIDTRSIVTTSIQKDQTYGYVLEYKNFHDSLVSHPQFVINAIINTRSNGGQSGIIPPIEALKLLRSMSFSLNQFNLSLDHRYIFQYQDTYYTLLHLAVHYSQINIVRVLLDPTGAIELAKNKGELSQKEYEQYNRDLENGFFPIYDVNCTNGFELTPLDYSHGFYSQNWGMPCGDLPRYDHDTKLKIIEMLQGKGAKLSDEVQRLKARDKEISDRNSQDSHILSSRQFIMLGCAATCAIFCIAKPDVVKSIFSNLKDAVTKYCGEAIESVGNWISR